MAYMLSFFWGEGVKATDVVQRHAPHFLLPLMLLLLLLLLCYSRPLA